MMFVIASLSILTAARIEPNFVTPFMKNLLNKRMKLRKKGRIIGEANLLANLMNNNY